jgi:hypothetical protein
VEEVLNEGLSEKCGGCVTSNSDGAFASSDASSCFVSDLASEQFPDLRFGQDISGLDGKRPSTCYCKDDEVCLLDYRVDALESGINASRCGFEESPGRA